MIPQHMLPLFEFFCENVLDTMTDAQELHPSMVEELFWEWDAGLD